MNLIATISLAVIASFILLLTALVFVTAYKKVKREQAGNILQGKSMADIMADPKLMDLFLKNFG